MCVECHFESIWAKFDLKDGFPHEMLEIYKEEAIKSPQLLYCHREEISVKIVEELVKDTQFLLNAFETLLRKNERSPFYITILCRSPKLSEIELKRILYSLYFSSLANKDEGFVAIDKRESIFITKQPENDYELRSPLAKITRTRSSISSEDRWVLWCPNR